MSENHEPSPTTDCNGICITGADLGLGSDAVAYPHPMCPQHGQPHMFELASADSLGRLMCTCRAYQSEHADQATPALLLLEAGREELHGYHDTAAALRLEAITAYAEHGPFHSG